MMTRSTKKNSIGLLRLLLTGLGLLTVGAAIPVQADTHSYASERRQIKACVLVTNAITGTGGGPQNVTPHVFYIMDRRSDLKPAGWEFVNPLAAGTITGDIYARWQTRGNGFDPAFSNTPAGVAFRVGQPLTKNFGAYWEVNLDNASTSDLQQFDVVLMAYQNNSQTQFTPDEREKLRRYADGGGTVWLEDEGNFNLLKGGSYGGGQFIVDLGFAAAIPANAYPTPASLHHPLINFPYSLAQTDILSLGAAGVQYDVNLTHHAHQGLNNSFTAPSGLANPRVLVPVIWAGTSNGQLPYVSAGDYGAGHIVVSSGGIATGINAYSGGANIGEGGNSAVTSGEQTLGARPVDLKFAYNMIAWTSSVPTAGVNARRTGSNHEDVGAQIGPRFATIPPVAQNPALPSYPSAGSGAIVHKGVVFYVDGNNVLHAYDASPQQDLDNDGNADDGIPDLIYGTPYDEIWRTDLKGLRGTLASTRISTPTIASVVNPTTGVPQDILMVSTSLGATLAFDAFPFSGGVLASFSPLVWSIASSNPGPDLGGDLVVGINTLQCPSPVFSDGVVFTIWNEIANDANHTWHIAAIDPLTGQEIFQESNLIGPTVAPSTLPTGTLGPGNIPAIPNPVGSLTAGYVRDTLTGALDKMIYVPTRTNDTTDTGAGTIHGVWFSTKGEPLENDANLGATFFSAKGTRQFVPWYLTAPPGNGVDLRPVVYKRSASGTMTRLIYNTDFTVQGQGAGAPHRTVVNISGVAAGDTFTVDYTLDWPADPLPLSGRPQVRDMVQFSERNLQITPNTLQSVPNLPAIHLFGSAALTPEDYLITGGGNYAGGDRIYALHDQFGFSSSVPGVVPKPNSGMAWMFYPNVPGVGTSSVPGRFVSSDTFFPPNTPGVGAPGPNVFVRNFQQIGSPAYSNGIVYATGSCQLQSDLSGTNQTPAMVIIALRANPDTTFTVQKSDGTVIPLPDFNAAMPLTLTQPDLINSTASNPTYVVLQENINFTVDRTSSSIHIFDFRSATGDAFNTAVPISVSYVGNPFAGPFINKQNGFGMLDNVLWWMTVPLDFQKFYPSPPNDPYPTAWIGSNPGGNSGLQPASGASVIGNTLYYGSTTGQIVSVDISGINPSGGQVNVYKDDGTSRVIAQAAIKGPDGFVVQLPQPIFSPPIATTGIVAVGTSQGLAVFDNQLTLIADNNRLLEVNRHGDAAWVMDGTHTNRLAQSVGANGSQIGTLAVTLNRPNMAHIYGLNDYVIADTGNNRVVELDHGGIVIWEMSKLSNDLRFLRDNDPVALNQPTDVQVYNTSGTGTLTFKSPVSKATYTYNPGANGSWVAIHYIIADSGNFRALEVVDVIGADGQPIVMNGSDGTNPVMQRQVVFATKAYGEQNQALRYRTIQQFTNVESGVFRTYMVAAVDNVRQAAELNPGAANVGTNANNVKGPGSSLVILKRYPPAGQGVDGDTAALINSLVYPDPAGTGIQRRQIISNPRWFKEFNVANPQNLSQPSLHYALADANGVYVLKPGTGPLTGEAVVEWALSNDDYYYMTGRHLNANSIQKTNQSDYDAVSNKFYPHYLITNGYTGRDNIFELFGKPMNVFDGEVHGEVVEVRSDYYTTLNGGHFNPNGGYRNNTARLYGVNGAGILSANQASAITWMVPSETIPVSAATAGVIKRKIGVGTNGDSTALSTGLLEQPTFSDRPF